MTKFFSTTIPSQVIQANDNLKTSRNCWHDLKHGIALRKAISEKSSLYFPQMFTRRHKLR
jgi:hypothetical protein